MRKLTLLVVGLVAMAGVTLAAPSDADAALRFGGDLIWMPVAVQDVETDQASLDSSHDLQSFGLSAHGNLGLDVFSLGLKVNYFNQAIDFDTESDDRFQEVDVNLMARVGIPTTEMALIGEGGLTTNPGFDFAGYNVGAAFEYDLLGLPLFDLNLGIMGQYVKVQEIDLTFDGEAADFSTGRGMLYIGGDFSL